MCSNKKILLYFIWYIVCIHLLEKSTNTGLVFNEVLRIGSYPLEWIEAVVVRAVNLGIDCCLSPRFRPVSLTNCWLTILGKIISKTILWLLVVEMLIWYCQNGFRTPHYTTDFIGSPESHSLIIVYH